MAHDSDLFVLYIQLLHSQNDFVEVGRKGIDMGIGGAAICFGFGAVACAGRDN